MVWSINDGVILVVFGLVRVWLVEGDWVGVVCMFDEVLFIFWYFIMVWLISVVILLFGWLMSEVIEE